MMDSYEELKNDVLTTFEETRTTLAGYLPQAYQPDLEHCEERLRAARFLVITCGEFRRGKSSLLNALTERRGLFPVDLDITTTAVTLLAWDFETRAVVHYLSDGETAKDPHEVQPESLYEFLTEQANADNRQRVSRAEITAPIDALKAGLVLADTPGVGSLNPAHAAATTALLRQADAVIFVASATEPLGTIELDFLAEATRQCPVLVTAITMIDKVVDSSPVLAAARERIAKVVDLPEEELVVIGVSALRKWTALEEQDPELLQRSGFPDLEEVVWGRLADACGVRQLEQALDAMDEAVELAAVPLSNELVALTDDEARQRVEGEARAAQTELKRLRAGSHEWRRNLQADLEHAARPARQRLSQDFDAIRDEFKRSLLSEDVLTNADQILSRMAAQLVDAAADAFEELGRGVQEVAQRYGELTSVELVFPDVAAAYAEGHDDSPREIALDPVRDVGQSRFTRFRLAAAGRSLGAATGTGAGLGLAAVSGVAWGAAGSLAAGGSVVLAPILAAVSAVAWPLALVAVPVGAVIGWWAGAREARRQGDERRRQQYVGALRDQGLPMIESARNQAGRDLDYVLRDCSYELVETLDRHITTQIQSVEESLARLGELARTTERQRQTRVGELTRLQNEFADLQANIDGLRCRVHER